MKIRNIHIFHFKLKRRNLDVIFAITTFYPIFDWINGIYGDPIYLVVDGAVSVAEYENFLLIQIWFEFSAVIAPRHYKSVFSFPRKSLIL